MTIMWHTAFISSQAFRNVAQSGLLNGVKVPLCRHYSHGHRSLIRRLERFTFRLQQKGWSSVTGSGDQGQNDQGSGQQTEEAVVSDKTAKLGSDSYFNKEILRRIKKKQTEQYFIYTENNLMDIQIAKVEYLLEDKDFEKLVKIRRSSPYSSRSAGHSEDGAVFIECAWTQDIEKLAIEKWGSLEKLQREKLLRQYRGWPGSSYVASNKKPTFYAKMLESFGKDSGAVVLVALLMNMFNAGFKGGVWILTGSPSMFSEFMHSCGDTMNQLFLAIGRYLSLQHPDASHPYGYRNHVHIWSILSGVMIFSLGCGLTLYHGILGILHPIVIDPNSLKWALYVLGGTLATESASLGYAILEISRKAKSAGMSFVSFVKDGDDPLCNVVLLEDAAGVIGVIICATAMTGSYILGMPLLDAIGSLVISGMLGGVSAFLFKTNADRLLGKALPYEAEIKKYMESDRFINAVLDNKTLDFGDESRFKSEVVLDAKLITKHFLNTEVDMDAMLVKWKGVNTTDDMEKFLEEFGSQIYDQIVAHVDRKEQDIKKKFPEIRHIDIEPS
ncbi:zinc transporter 9-like [Mercenaria mercenaria]|uniref:zinc transporter 9-like n=1 Tax=Mercenaria mercenaria TaxID=6596 RepID=UPI00234F988E|nr:zinc transporter 9-like [Mercenaria mercenaria]